MHFVLHILGCHSAVPQPNKFPSAQILQIDPYLFLIDCGEGTQLRMSEQRIKRSKIDHIFISHLHGDHVFGLPGLLSSFQLVSRTRTIHIYGPPGIKAYVEGMIACTDLHLDYKLVIHQHDQQKSVMVFDTPELKVSTIPLDHRRPTTGYLFEYQSNELNLKQEILDAYDLSIEQIKRLKGGEDIKVGNLIMQSKDATTRSTNHFSYAYCSDTKYSPDIIPIINNVQVLYHESTFLHEAKDIAREKGHSTSVEAATIAKLANADTLILGHYSTRYSDLEQFLEEAQPIFPNTVLGLSGKKYKF